MKSSSLWFLWKWCGNKKFVRRKVLMTTKTVTKTKTVNIRKNKRRKGRIMRHILINFYSTLLCMFLCACLLVVHSHEISFFFFFVLLSFFCDKKKFMLRWTLHNNNLTKRWDLRSFFSSTLKCFWITKKKERQSMMKSNFLTFWKPSKDNELL